MITKLGTDYFKGQKQDIYLIASTVTSDGELKSTHSGKTFGTCSCKAMEKEDGTAVWVAVKSFSELVRDRIASAVNHGGSTSLRQWCDALMDANQFDTVFYTEVGQDC